jgi:hypothetical protein
VDGTGPSLARIPILREVSGCLPRWGKPSTGASTTSLGAAWMLRGPGDQHRCPRPRDDCVRPRPGLYGCPCGSFAEYRGSTGLHGQRRRVSDWQTPRSEALFAVWQVQCGRCRTRTCVGIHPTDLQNDAPHALTCGFTAPSPDFRKSSPRGSTCPPDDLRHCVRASRWATPNLPWVRPCTPRREAGTLSDHRLPGSFEGGGR